MYRGHSKQINCYKDIGKGDGTMGKSFILRKGTAPDGIDIQLENWHDIYSHIPESSTIGAYPKAKISITNIGNIDYPKRGKEFRCFFEFPNSDEAFKAYCNLICGITELTDYLDYFSGNPEHKQCI